MEYVPGHMQARILIPSILKISFLNLDIIWREEKKNIKKEIRRLERWLRG